MSTTEKEEISTAEATAAAAAVADNEDPNIMSADTTIPMTIKPPGAATASNLETDDSCDSTTDSNDNDDESETRMPLLHYCRLFSAVASSSSSNANQTTGDAAAAANSLELLAPPKADLVTASCFGKVVLNAESTPLEPSTTEHVASNSDHSLVTNAGQERPPFGQRQRQPPMISLWQREPISLLWIGKESGALGLWMIGPASAAAAAAAPVWMVSGTTCNTSASAAATVATRKLLTLPHVPFDDTNALQQQTSNSQRRQSSASASASASASPANRKIVDVSMDASGTLLAALNRGGMLGVFQVKYKLVWTTAENVTAESGDTIDDSAPATAARSVPSTITTTSATAGVKSKSSHLLSGILSAFKGPKQQQQQPVQPQPQLHAQEQQQQEQQSTIPTEPDDSTALVPTLAFASIALAHSIRYPQSFGPPSCLVVDPASTHRRELSVVVGFCSGRLLLTRKRGMFVQRRVDSVLYQGVGVAANDENDDGEGPSSQSYCGIEAVTWRGSLLAWADASGIRIMDMDTLTRLAHVDRPTGAKPSLYPTIRDLKPHLVFETADVLLCGWGDCLLSLRVRDVAANNVSASAAKPQATSSSNISSNSSLSSDGGGELLDLESDGADGPMPATESADDRLLESSSTRQSPTTSPAPPHYGPAARQRRIVECIMAWQLDCVAAGVAPMDEEHVVVLGLVPPLFDDDENELVEEEILLNEAEIQVISRSTGAVVHSDLLPLRKADLLAVNGDKDTSDLLQNSIQDYESMCGYNLLSSFSFPKMGNAKELKEDQQRLQQAGGVDLGLFSSGQRATYIDPHLKWRLEMSVFGSIDNELQDEAEESSANCDSVDSDDYGAIFKPASCLDTSLSAKKDSSPPCMIIVSGIDVVLTRLNDIDDAVAHALTNKRAGLALRRALPQVRRLRRFDIRDLVNEYFRALLRLPSKSHLDSLSTQSAGEDETDLDKTYISLRRMKLAAEAMPILLGGDVDMWIRWMKEIEKIPGALFMARKFVPVRDPVLPKHVYGDVLKKMLLQVEHMAPGKLADEAAGHFLDTLVAWGSTSVLKRFIKLFQYECKRDRRVAMPLRAMEESFKRRQTQSAACYLQISNGVELKPVLTTDNSLEGATANDTVDELYDIDDMAAFVSSRNASDQLGPSGSVQFTGPMPDTSNSQLERVSRVSLEASVRLEMMKGSFDDALRYYLLIGSGHSPASLDDAEEEAIAFVNQVAETDSHTPLRQASYTHVLSIIESLHLHQCLLDSQFLALDGMPPLFALLQLVGLDTLGEFLIENCVSPQNIMSIGYDATQSGATPLTQAQSDKTGGSERRGTLPVDLVAKQLERRPKLLHWYLHLVFTRKPEVYVRFPMTATPPEEIIRLHRKQIDLYLRFAGNNRDSSSVFRGIEAYRVSATCTPLLTFLKVTIQVGVLSTTEIAKKIEVERKGGDGNSHTFALELAYIMEEFGGEDESEARLVLELYLKGVESLMLAVSFAQRSRLHRDMLWKILIDYCLESVKKEAKGTDGSLFGSLFEAAALAGGDLANLISEIPPDMAIEGLRPRLVAAVTDYRLKVLVGESAAKIAGNERISLLREIEYRARRGHRVELASAMTYVPVPVHNETLAKTNVFTESPVRSTTFVRTPLTPPKNYHRFSLSLAIH